MESRVSHPASAQTRSGGWVVVERGKGWTPIRRKPPPFWVGGAIRNRPPSQASFRPVLRLSETVGKSSLRATMERRPLRAVLEGIRRVWPSRRGGRLDEACCLRAEGARTIAVTRWVGRARLRGSLHRSPQAASARNQHRGTAEGTPTLVQRGQGSDASDQRPCPPWSSPAPAASRASMCRRPV